MASSPITPETLDELVDTDPLRLRDVAVALLAQAHDLAAERDAAVTDTERLGLEVQALTEERDAARAEQTRLLAEVEDERRRRASYVQGMRAGYDAEIDRLKRNGEALIDRAVQAEAGRDEARADLAEQKARNGELIAEMQRTRKAADEARAALARTSRHRDYLGQRLDKVTKEANGRKGHGERLRADLAAVIRENNSLSRSGAQAECEAARHLEHLRIAFPRHFTPNLIGQRLCGCDGEWPCREQVDLAEQVQHARDLLPEIDATFRRLCERLSTEDQEALAEVHGALRHNLRALDGEEATPDA